MRIAIGGIEHETNTYAQGYTEIGDFMIRRGAQLLRTSGQESNLGGAVDACVARDVTAVPLLHAWTQPSGTIARQAYETMAEELLDRLADAAPIDGLLLLLHGAGVVDGLEDMEADLVMRIRRAVGEELPIVATFDLHGNVTQAMADALQGIFACHHYPHVDLHERSHEAVDLLIDMYENNRRSRCSVVDVPMLIPTTTTFGGPGGAMLQRVLESEAAERDAAQVVDVSWFHGFPYTDVPHVGSMIAVTTYGDDGEQIARRVAETLWAARDSFRPESLSAEEAVTQALALREAGTPAPIVINETSDNCGGGSPGDGTHLLRAMLDAGLGARAVFGFVVDPQTVADAIAAGVGASLDVTLGGRTDDLHGAPLAARADVRAISDGRLVMTHMFRGTPLNLGPMVRLTIEGMDVIVASRRSQTFDLEPFLAVGVDVARYDVVALKSSNHFRACFKDVAGAIVTADTPGLCTLQVEVFERQRTARRLWPLHEDAVFGDGKG